ncbi:histidinol-phosphate transaminase [Hornefia porci]|uniref:Histidinol-phosphate aminotransferase n=1 Tax=Hornefia porci TaxID=2652292 RepID=A0A1Q9JGW3_9FIRM|nr:histidinol-phosphate transaminase [Hornefia porci]OLR55448.1 histidinol-phosphate transaminase [Hornefia porci]
MSRYLNQRFRTLDAYTPGEQPKDTVYTKLNTNESPYPPGPETQKAVCGGEAARNLRLYSDPDSVRLKDAIADRYGVGRSNVFVSNGSDDILNFAFMAFAEDGAVFPDITYGFYPVFGDLHRVDYARIPLREDFTLNPEDYKGRGRMIVIANPNAPTGLEIRQEDIAALCASDPEHVVLIDEAYVDFGGTSAIPLTKEYENLLVVQTFSKSRSLAGARLGYAIASEALIGDLERIKYSTNPYNVNSLTAAAGVAAIGEDDYYSANCLRTMSVREWTISELKKTGFQVLPSIANFVFAKSDRIDGGALYQKLKERKILIRHFDNPRITQYNRITIGTQEEMERLMAAIREILREEESR